MVRVSGIYAIHNLISGKKYIGQSINCTKRYYEHFKLLRAGTHHSKHLQHSFNKYGEKVFIFGIIEECPKEQLCLREHYWIKYFDSYNNGYNSTEITEKGGRIYSEEDKKIYSNRGINQWNKLTIKEKKRVIQTLNDNRPDVSKSVTLYNKDTFEKELEFKCFKDCGKYFGKTHKRIAKIIQKLYYFNNITYKRYIFIKEGDTLDLWKERKLKHEENVKNNILKYRELQAANKPKKELLPIEVKKESWRQNAIKASKALRNSGKYKVKVFIAETGEFYKEYNLLQDACDDLGLNRKRINKNAWNKTKIYKGYIFEKQY